MSLELIFDFLLMLGQRESLINKVVIRGHN